MGVITRQQLENASLDAATLESVINGSASLNGTGLVTSRLGTSLKTLAKIVAELSVLDIGSSAAALINQRITDLQEELEAKLTLSPAFSRVNFSSAGSTGAIIGDFPGAWTSGDWTIEFKTLFTTTADQVFIHRNSGVNLNLQIYQGRFFFGSNNFAKTYNIVANTEYICRITHDVTKSGINRLDVYLNNVLATPYSQLGSYGSGFATVADSADIRIGYNFANTERLTGWMERIKYWDAVVPPGINNSEHLILNLNHVEGSNWIDVANNRNAVLSGSFTYTDTEASDLIVLLNEANQDANNAIADIIKIASDQTTRLNVLENQNRIQEAKINATVGASVTSPSRYRGFGLSGGVASIPITGSFSNSGNVEASFNGGAWQTIVTRGGSGAFSGTLTGQVAGVGDLLVRPVSAPHNTVVVNDIVVGNGYLICGDSIAEGQGTNKQSHALPANLRPSVYKQNNTWAEANDPVDTATLNGSHWPLLATLLSLDNGIPVFFVTTATGSTDIIGAGVTYYSKGNAGYTILTTQAAGAVGPFKELLLHFGPNAATDNSLTAAAYQTALETFATNVKADISNSIIIRMGCHGESANSGNNLEIRKGTIQAVNNSANLEPGANLLGMDFADNVHPKTDAELATVAARWFATLKGKPSPNVVSATLINSTTVDVLFDADLDADVSVYTPSVWRIVAGSNLTPSTVTRTGVRTIRLSMGSSVSAGHTVHFVFDDLHKNAVLPTGVKQTLPKTINGITYGANPINPIFGQVIV